MAKALVGEAAIRIVPTLRGFKPEADRRLKAMTFDPLEVQIDPAFKKAEAQMKAWRAKERLNAINVPVKADFSESRASFAAFRRELTTVEHIFKRSALQRAMRLNVKIIGLDALPALAYAAGSAAAGVDGLAKSLLALPGIAGGALASIGALAVGLRGVGDAFRAFGEQQKNAAQNARDIESANRDIQRSYRDYRSAVRDTVREIQDLNAENRRSSLNIADAVLSVQEAADKLRKGGQKSINELRRDQLDLAMSIEHLQDVQTRANRTMQDTAEANAKGVAGADRVVDALDRIAEATDQLNQKQGKGNDYAEKLAALAPEARKAMEAVLAFEGQWKSLTLTVQNNLWDGLDRSITNLGQKALPGLEIGLSRVASGLNANFKTVAESLGGDTSQGLLARIFGNTEGGLKNFSKAMNPLIEGVLRLTKEGSDYLPRLGEAAEKVFTRFDDWTKRISEDGSLDKWIDNGLKTLTDLGNAASNIMSIISSVSDAFREAGGDETGFVGTLEKLTRKWAEFLKSTDGKNKLAEYFDRAREFMNDLREAFSKMRPFIKDVVDTAREWSVVLLDTVGALAKTAAWIEENTGLLKVFLGTYLLVRTATPIVNGLTTAWKNYNTVIEKAATSANSPSWLRNNSYLQWTRGQLQKAKGNVGELSKLQSNLNTSVATTGSRYDVMGSKIDAAKSKVVQLRTEMERMASTPMAPPAVASVQNAANTALVTSRADEKARRAAAGIGLSSTPLQERLAAANTAYISRETARKGLGSDRGAVQQVASALALQAQWAQQAERGKPSGSVGPTGPINPALYGRLAEMRNAKALEAKWRADAQRAGIGGSTTPLWQRLRNAENVVRIRDRFNQPMPYVSRRYDAAMQGANLPGWRGGAPIQPTQQTRAGYFWQGPLRDVPKGETIRRYGNGEYKAPALGPMQGPALPPHFTSRGPTEFKAPKLGAMQGPQLTPDYVNKLARESRAAGPPVSALGKQAIDAGTGIKRAGDITKAAYLSTADLNREVRTANQRFPALTQAVSGVTPPLNGMVDTARASSTQLAGVSRETRTLANSRFPALLQVTDKVPPALNGVVSTAGTASSQIKTFGTEVGGAADKVGKPGGAGIGLLGRLGALGGALAPGALLMAGLLLVTSTVKKLGEAHEAAATAADKQANALRGVVSALDQVTGAATNQAIDKTAENFQGVNVPGVFDDKHGGPANSIAAMQRLGIDTTAATLAATDATQDGLLEQIMAPIRKQAQEQIVNSDAFKRAESYFKGTEITPEFLVLAALGDQEKAETFKNVTERIEQIQEMAGQHVDLPDLAEIWNSVGNKDPLLAGYAIQTQADATRQGAAAIAERAKAARGSFTLNPANPGPFAAFSPDGQIVAGQTGQGILTLNQIPDAATIDAWVEQGLIDGPGWVKPDGRTYQLELTPEATANHLIKGLPQFRDGGMVRGPGGPTSDSILARVSKGEHIARAEAVRYYGEDLFNALNRKALPRFSVGGWPMLPQSPLTPAIPSPAPAPGPANVGGIPAPSSVAASVPPPPAPMAPPAVTTPVETFSTPTTVSAAPATASSASTPSTSSATSTSNPLTHGLRAGFLPGTVQVPTRTPYGLKAGTAIDYGADGFPTWVYALAERFGLQASTYKDHQEKDGLNKGIDWSGPVANMQAFADYVKSVPGLEQVIWENPETGVRVGVDPGDRGENQSIDDYYRDDWADHRNHVHTRQSASIPLPEELGFLLGGVDPYGISSLMPGGSNEPKLTPLEAMKAKWEKLFDFEARYAEALDPQNVFNFLGGQASAVGSSLLGIGSDFLSGITGINFGAIIKPGQDIANEFLSFDPDSDDESGGNGADVAGVALEQWGQGIPGIGSDLQSALGGFNPAFSAPGKKGGNTYRPLVRQVLQMVAANYGITELQKWEDALVKQIDTESGGDPFSINANDSDGKGGKQTVKGLLNFLPATFDAHNILGGTINDPAAQIAAAIDYLCTSPKYDGGIGPDGGPVQIGRGQGFKSGGYPRGLAWLSNGEFRTNADATRYYGPALFDALNAKAIPREAIRGFAEGGWPLLDPQQPGQTPGPLPMPGPLTPPAAAGPSTGGAPGPGATAPAPDPGALPGVADAMAGIGGGLPQPGANAPQAGDPRSVLGAAPVSNDHNNPALSGAISGAASTVGGLIGSAIGAAGAAGGAVAPGAGQAAGMAAQGAQAAAAIGGQVINGAVNILSSLAVGTATNGSTASASGVPMLPQRQPQQTGVPPVVQRVDNRQYHITNLDEFKRVQAVSDAQAAMPFIGKYG
ncbi:tape measure protein [Mycobacterium phage SlimJimmy]|uniref:Tape measure protein n=1 Tax=Mycobacterium phage Bricole TaxID=1718601 RepID=A0A0M4R2F1_9CAUD|nr:tape measure protein [Mycobacterium phage Bricole]WMI33207.1 tape measure protein [Mycobacterium phage SlimJimmy]